MVNVPVVSIITPALNASSTLADAIESVRAQTFSAWEMIIVDDHSEDSTIALAARYAEEDARIRVIRCAESGGAARARNKGLQAARGRYAAFLDAGDTWLPQKLQMQMDFMETHRAAMCCTAYRRFENNEPPGRILTCPAHVTFNTLLKRNCVVLSTVLLDREQTGMIVFDESLGAREELALWLNLTKSGFDIHFLPQDLARIHVHPRDGFTTMLHRFWWTWFVYRDIGQLSPIASFASTLRNSVFATLRRAF